MYVIFKPMHCTYLKRFSRENMLPAFIPTQVRHLDIYSTVSDTHNYVIISLPIQRVSVHAFQLTEGRHFDIDFPLKPDYTLT